MKLRTLTAAATAAALLAVACGGGEPDVAATTEATATAAGTGTATATATATGTATGGQAVPEDWPDELVLGLVPSREAGQLVESAEPLATALEDALGVPVEAFVPTDYAALTEAMASGQAHIGAFGPLGVVRAIDRAGAEFVLQSLRFGSDTYHTQYMTHVSNADTYCLEGEPEADEEGFLYCNGTLDAETGPVGDEAIAGIEPGTSLAYVDPTSTSGYLIPALQMIEQGVDIEALDSTFAGGHDASVIAVYNQDVEIGLSFDDARTEIIEQSPDVGEQVVVWAYSEEIPNDGFVVAGELPDDLKQAIVDAMLEFASTEEGTTVLGEIYNIEGLQEPEEGALDVVRRADEQFGDEFIEG